MTDAQPVVPCSAGQQQQPDPADIHPAQHDVQRAGLRERLHVRPAEPEPRAGLPGEL